MSKKLFIKKNGDRKHFGRTVWEYTKASSLALFLALIIRSSVVQAYVIPSGSMIGTLEIGDRIMVSKIHYDLKLPLTGQVILPIRQIKRGHIVVFDHPAKHVDMIKRVIGLPGDHVEIIDKSVVINGQPLDEPYARYSDQWILPREITPRDNYGPTIVPEGKIFVLGDNRDNSYDSRYWGFVNMDSVRGKAGLLLWSWDPAQLKFRWSRMLTWIH